MANGRTIFLPYTAAMSLGLILYSPAQASELNLKADLGFLELSYAHVPWPTPDSLTKNLETGADQTRIQALVQMGISSQRLIRPTR